MTQKGADGADKIAAMMTAVRTAPPADVAGRKVLAVRDYLCGERRDFVTGEIAPVGLPESNVLYFELEGGAWCCVRPSGTEPKIKFYIGAKGTSVSDAQEQLAALKEGFLQLFREE